MSKSVKKRKEKDRSKLKNIVSNSKSLSDVYRSKAEIVSGVRNAHNQKRKGNISDESFSNYLNQRHLGFTKLGWLKKCNEFVVKKEKELNEGFNKVIESKSNPRLNLALILLLVFAGIYLVGPSLTGYVISEAYNTTIEMSFDENSTVLIDAEDLSYFALNGHIERGFVGKVYLDGSERHLVLDYSVSSLDEEVENSSIEFDVLTEEVSSEVIGLNIEASFENDSYVCAVWEIEDTEDDSLEELCYGNSDCCLFLGMSQDSDIWNETLYVNPGRYDSGDRNIVKAQLVYANYSLDVADSYSDIRYSDKKGRLVDIFDILEFSEVCGEACNIEELSGNYTIEIIVEEGSVYLGNFSYRLRVVPNRAPLFEDLPNVTIVKNSEYLLDLSSYLSDADEDSLELSYFEMDDVIIEIDEMEALIIPDVNFSGKAFTFFTANDSAAIAISNIIEINVIENVSEANVTGINVTEVNVTVEENATEGFSPISQVEIGKPVVWKKTIAVNESLGNISVNVSGFASNITVTKINGSLRENVSVEKIEIIDNNTKESLVEFVEKREEEDLNRNLMKKIRYVNKNRNDLGALEELKELLNDKIGELDEDLDGATRRERIQLRRKIRVGERLVSRI
jgi:hypothetical protein